MTQMSNSVVIYNEESVFYHNSWYEQVNVTPVLHLNYSSAVIGYFHLHVLIGTTAAYAPV